MVIEIALGIVLAVLILVVLAAVLANWEFVLALLVIVAVGAAIIYFAITSQTARPFLIILGAVMALGAISGFIHSITGSDRTDRDRLEIIEKRRLLGYDTTQLEESSQRSSSSAHRNS